MSARPHSGWFRHHLLQIDCGLTANQVLRAI
ncbi:MAG: hypothetical protein ACJAQ3_002092 [Planctomycetota bacterium]|jgi:hypothetical protein